MRAFSALVTTLMIVVTSPSFPAEERVSLDVRTRPTKSVTPSPNIRINVQLLQIPIIVTDERGQPVIDLEQNAFRIFEDKVERPVIAFSITDSPVSAALVFDSSRSMRGRMGDAKASIERFLDLSLPGDEFALVRFSTSTELMVPLTRDSIEISKRLNSVEPGGWTSLFDAIELAVHQVHTARNNRKVLIVFSDGGDNNSRYSESELIAKLREMDVQVFAVSMFERSRSLERIAQETGGRAVCVRRLDNLRSVMEAISRQMRSTYLIGCVPVNPANDGKYHPIRVEVQSPTRMLSVSWRRGYIASFTSERQTSLE